jgi:hypothetical protein
MSVQSRLVYASALLAKLAETCELDFRDAALYWRPGSAQ